MSTNTGISPDSVAWVIDLTLDENDKEYLRVSYSNKRLKTNNGTACTPKVKTETNGVLNDTDDQKPAPVDYSDEVEVVAPAENADTIMQEAASATLGDDVCAVVGTKNSVRLPHMRQHCTEKPFQQTNSGISNSASRAINAEYCDLCYCYVCDVPVKECTTHWEFGEAHCFATDQGRFAHYWSGKRKAAKNPTAPPTQVVPPVRYPNAAAPVHAKPHLRCDCPIHYFSDRAYTKQDAQQNRKRCFNCVCFMCKKPASQCTHWFGDYNSHCNAHDTAMWKSMRDFGPGPFSPENKNVVDADESLLQCHHCKWYNRPSPTGGCRDWCGACGRVASAKSLGPKMQSVPFTAPRTDQISLGVKEIAFTLHAHDPRKMKAYEKLWNEHSGTPGWDYNESLQHEELFRHRLGVRPTLESILVSVPTVEHDRIPVDGTISDSRVPAKNTVFCDETEALLFENPSDLIIFREIFRNAPNFGQKKQKVSQHSNTLLSHWLEGDMEASWSSDTNTGTIRLRVFVSSLPPSSTNARDFAPTGMTRFLGTWFGVLPFKLSDVFLNLKAKGTQKAHKRDVMEHLLPNPKMPRKELEEAQKTAKQLKTDAMKQYNDSVTEFRGDQFLLDSSSGSRLLGGTCRHGNNFDGMLKRFFEEIVPELVPQLLGTIPNPWLDTQLHVASDHRRLKRTEGSSYRLEQVVQFPKSGVFFDSYLNQEDYAVVMRTVDDACDLERNTSSLGRLMDRLENRGHAAAPFVEGLTCELLPFQQQTLQWAIERETTPGGLQSFFWTKLPKVAEQDSDVYFNPVLGKLSTKQPSLVRGGIIAEQMGLGKTVISLALILENPAPTEPATGSPVAAILPQPAGGSPFWDPDLYASTSSSNAKRGSILSHGTLVVCNVSLVGQWIEEAKSKLKNPGLVYSYHGCGRRRIPQDLAANSIVVTTYETLASDATSHAAKSGDESYCPPCEQVRWWRVICDESHVLRNTHNKSRAVLNLVADNKWLVSGTPINTTVLDLANQLKFLGIEHAGDYMNLFKKTFLGRIGDSAPGKRGRTSLFHGGQLPGLGMFTFLMRSIMIRHSQNQKYSGTGTTLMSLPPKTERVVTVKFSKEEKHEYAVFEESAQSFFRKFRAARGRHKLSKYYLYLTQKLTPLRVACSGGRVPLDDDDGSAMKDVSPDQSDNDEEAEDATPKGGKKKEQRFSEFAFTSKLIALVNELTRVRQQDTTAKSLVFSQYTSTLKYLQSELPKHGFQFRTLSGDMSMKKRAKALRDFQNDPPTTVFLLSMRAGAVGINLTQASNVFIMEPCFNPALEAQAIGRVHRLGQKRSVDIVRLIMEESIEVRIRKMLDEKYGTSVSASASGDEIPDEDKKPAAKASIAAVGCLTTDKAAVMADEFELLFGVEGEEDKTNDATTVDAVGSASIPDAVGSSVSM